MRIRMLTSIAGRTWSAISGQTITVNDDEAVRLIQAGHAEPEPPVTETATVGAPENAAIRTRPPQPRQRGKEFRS